MREIKFRAYIKELGKTYEVISLMTKKFEGEDFLRAFINKDQGDGEPANYSIDGVDNVLMQYTGLKDKNGIPIYENDILKFLARGFMESETKEAKAIIKYCEENMGFILTDFEGNETASNLTKSYDDGEFEIIGNIYENKDLLEQKE